MPVAAKMSALANRRRIGIALHAVIDPII